MGVEVLRTRVRLGGGSTLCRILEAFSKLAETSRRGTGSAIGDPEQTSPADHPFRPTGAPELLCGVAVVIAEQAAQSLTTSHLPVRTADAFFRFEQRVPEPSMVALSVIMMDELSDGTAQRWLTEEDHPLQATRWGQRHSRLPARIVIPAADELRQRLGSYSCPDPKLLIYGLFQKGRVLAQDDMVSRTEAILQDVGATIR